MSDPAPINTHKIAYFERIADKWDSWKSRNRYYYDEMRRLLTFLIPAGSQVLEVGCATGDELAAIQPSKGFGIDFSARMVRLARRKHPHLHFAAMSAEQMSFRNQFDYILACNLVGDLDDVQSAVRAMHRVSHPGTRLIITYYNYLWEPILKLGERLGLKRPVFLQNWLSLSDLKHVLTLGGFETITADHRVLLPIYIPLLSFLINGYIARLPGIGRLGLLTYLVARPNPQPIPVAAYSVSIIIPCRNERGTIEAAVLRTPVLGKYTELIFVDGNSTDGTPQEIERMIQAHPHRDIKLIHQGQGKGKGDAVRKGFAAASGDVLMILDADLTVAPEDMSRFYLALSEGHGEFINGSRMVYPLERQAMRFLNLLGNHFFSWAFTWILGQRFRDTLCGTKVILRKDYERLASGRSYFGDFDPFGDFDLILGAVKLNLKVCEVPVRYRARVYGETNISRFTHGLLLLRMTWVAARKFRFAGSRY
jgi:SAM-dependent methyltransferase